MYKVITKDHSAEYEGACGIWWHYLDTKSCDLSVSSVLFFSAFHKERT